MKIEWQMVVDNMNYLIGCRLVRYKRICDMICLYFANTDAENSCVSEPNKEELYGLHIECWCRFLGEDKVIAASEEMYYPFDAKKEAYRYDKDISVFDVSVEKIVKYCEDSRIEAIELSATSDLRIRMDNGYIIEILAYRSDSDDEMWRFIAGSDVPHIIASMGLFECSDE